MGEMDGLDRQNEHSEDTDLEKYAAPIGKTDKEKCKNATTTI